GRLVRDLQIPEEQRETIADAAFSPDGQTLALAVGHYLELWDLHTGKRQLRVDGSRLLTAVAFRPDGKQVAAGGPGRQPGQKEVSEGIGVLWLDVQAGRWARKYSRQDPRPCSKLIRLVFSPDGKTLAAFGVTKWGHLFLFDATSEE